MERSDGLPVSAGWWRVSTEDNFTGNLIALTMGSGSHQVVNSLKSCVRNPFDARYLR